MLPVKLNNKLIFTLCFTCAKFENNGDCLHNEERAITGTWVSDEIIKAVEKGYKPLKIFEIWQYKIEQYINKSSEGLFTQMMNTFLKIKQEASGWPEECTKEMEKLRYVGEFYAEEGIRLDYNKIEKNPGLRLVAKLLLNSFWGKMGQRENQLKTKIVHNPEEFFNMMCDTSIEICNILPVNDQTLIVNFEYREETFDILPTVNVCIAAYVTAQARLKLYSYLEVLDRRVLYYDTDSIVFTSN